MADELEKALGNFLRKARGERTFAEFSRRIGLPVSTLNRLERGEQSITLCRLQHIMRRLNCSLYDVFGTVAKRTLPRRLI